MGLDGCFPDVRDNSVECDEDLEVLDTKVLLSASSLKKIRDLQTAHMNEAAAV